MITSIQNNRICRAAGLKKRAVRDRSRLFLVEGVQGVMEAVARPGAVREIFHTPSARERADAVLEVAARAGVETHAVSEDVMRHLTSTVTPQGLVAVAGFVDVSLEEALAAGGCVAMLVEVRDPGNAGTIMRSADAAGAAAVVFTRSSVDVYNPKAVRATAGSLFHVPVVRGVRAEEAIAGCRAKGFRVLAASAGGRHSIHEVDLTVPTVVLFGNEARGLPEGVGTLADQTVRVPIRGAAESLNLAAAATLILFEAARQRSGPPPLAGMVSGAAHDIRSPLTALKAYGSTLASRWTALSEEQRLSMLGAMSRDAARMEATVSQLLEAARLQSGELRLERRDVELLALVRRVAAEIAGWSALDVQTTGDEVNVTVDPDRLRTIVLGMIEAAQWWGEEGAVRVVVETAGVPTVRVSRAGCWADPAEVRNLFQPRLPGSGSGSKLGLHVARGLAEAQQGSLDVRIDGEFALTLRLPPTA